MAEGKIQESQKTHNPKRTVPLKEGDFSNRSREIARKGPTPTPPIKKD